MVHTAKLVPFLIGSLLLIGCEPKAGVALPAAAPPSAPAPTPAAAAAPLTTDTSIRFDFVLTSGDTSAPSTTAFTLNMASTSEGR